MDIDICEKILEHRGQLVPALLTERQVDLVQKYVQHQKLTAGEQAYFYSAIRRKMDALRVLREEYYIRGTNMIPERIEEAKQILREMPEKAFISGSYLYSQQSQDLDIFVLSRRRRQRHVGKRHFIYLTAADLQKPLSVSAANCSVANFPLIVKPIIKREPYAELLLTYQLAINEILDDDDQKTIRRIIFEYYVHTKKKILDSFSLHQEFFQLKEKKTKEKIMRVNQMYKELLLQLYSRRYLYAKLGPFLKSLKDSAQEYSRANENILIYIDLLTEVRHECRRNKI